MNGKDVVVIIAAILVVFLLITEFVACQWHADNLTHGCRSNGPVLTPSGCLK
jgi:hypothetical protein